MGYARDRKAQSVSLRSVEVSLPFVKGTWEADRDQQRAAWELYVELVTRISVEPMDNVGLLREAMNSLQSLFSETRRVLKHYGSSVAVPAAKGSLSLGSIAIQILNGVLRPFLSKWHPELQAHEALRSPGASPGEHERRWERRNEVLREFEQQREILSAYADLLAQAAGISDPRK
jgi:hypothetical protein